MLGGIGFTMSVFIAGLAFTGQADLTLAKIGVLAGSLVSGISGWIGLRGVTAQQR
jgi:NhaA family Na+:H+ antiporter